MVANALNNRKVPMQTYNPLPSLEALDAYGYTPEFCFNVVNVAI
jgi:hypothetical protein